MLGPRGTQQRPTNAPCPTMTASFSTARTRSFMLFQSIRIHIPIASGSSLAAPRQSPWPSPVVTRSAIGAPLAFVLCCCPELVSLARFPTSVPDPLERCAVSRPPIIVPHPGPAPRAPVLPHAAIGAVEAALQDLIAVAETARRRHEDAVGNSASVVQFEGDAATTFRVQLTGQLRRLRAMVADLEADLDTLLAARRAGSVLEARYVAESAAHARAVAAHQASLVARDRWLLEHGPGPRVPPSGTEVGWWLSQPVPGQPVAGQPVAGRSVPGQPVAGRSVAGPPGASSPMPIDQRR